jgi:DNA adenine methylase
MLLEQVLTSRNYPEPLADVVKHHLGIVMDKGLQKSDWSTASLSLAQLQYAANDAAILLPLFQVLEGKLKTANLIETVELECACLPAVVWLAQGGVVIDRQRWQALAEKTSAKLQEIDAELHRLAPPKPPKPPKPRARKPPEPPVWNFGSNPQKLQIFKALGIHLPNVQKETLAQVDHPLAHAMQNRGSVSMLASTFGLNVLENISADGRLYPGWHQIGTVTGRMSASAPAFQNIPKHKSPEHRYAVIAPPGRVLVRCDMSQIELRVAAKLSGDPVMLKAFQNKEDLHAKTARAITGKEEITKVERDLSKSLGFGILYGMTEKGLQRKARNDFGIDLTEAQASAYLRKFLDTYPGLKRWRQRQQALVRSHPTATHTLLGRRHLSVDTTTKVVNYPVQGTAGDLLKQGMTLLWRRRGEVPENVRFCLAVHDELVVECDEQDAEKVAEWLKRAMLDGAAPALAPVPAEAEVSWARTWGGNPPKPVTDPQNASAGQRSPAEPARVSAKGTEHASNHPGDEEQKGGSATSRLIQPLKWHGGKHYLATKIIALMPPHLHYVEPYAGGLAVLLARDPDDPRLSLGTGVSELVNDRDGHLINFWRVLQDEVTFEKFRRMVEAIPLSRSEWRRAHDHQHGADPIADAVAFFVDCRQSLAGRQKSFTAITRNRTRRQMNGSVSKWLGAIEGLPAVHARLRRVLVENKPALEIIRTEDGPATLFYCDPPYLHETRTARTVYDFEMSEAEHRELLDVLRHCKGKVMLSGYPSELYDRALTDWNRHTFDLPNNAAGGARKRRETEVLWCNW